MRVRITGISLNVSAAPMANPPTPDTYNLSLTPVIDGDSDWSPNGAMTTIQLPLINAPSFKIGAIYDLSLTPVK